ncbi:MAG: peptide deformylase, partial [Betaproteobacteria bacterium]|nr:peptide deformylase [Betaproteobacteria bacterium]
MGNPDLLKVSEPIDFEKDDLKKLIEDMKETMKANDGAGLAAPQIGV